MKMKLLNRGKGVSLRAIHIAMIVCAVVISLLLVFSTHQSASVFLLPVQSGGGLFCPAEGGP